MCGRPTTGPRSLEVLFSIGKPRDPGCNSGGGAYIGTIPYLIYGPNGAVLSYGNCCTLTLFGVEFPKFTRIGSRSLPLPVYIAFPSMFTSVP